MRSTPLPEPFVLARVLYGELVCDDDDLDAIRREWQDPATLVHDLDGEVVLVDDAGTKRFISWRELPGNECLDCGIALTEATQFRDPPYPIEMHVHPLWVPLIGQTIRITWQRPDDQAIRIATDAGDALFIASWRQDWGSDSLWIARDVPPGTLAGGSPPI